MISAFDATTRTGLPESEVYAVKYAELKGRHLTEISLGSVPLSPSGG